METRFVIGQKVRSTKDSGSNDWEDNDTARKRPWGVVGRVIKVHDSHGLCYRVRLCWSRKQHSYEHGELEAA